MARGTSFSTVTSTTGREMKNIRYTSLVSRSTRQEEQVFHNYPWLGTHTDMRRLRWGYVLRIASLGDFVVVRTCTYTNLGITV